MEPKALKSTKPQHAEAHESYSEVHVIESAHGEDLEAAEDQSQLMKLIKWAIETLTKHKNDLDDPMQLPLFSVEGLASEWRSDTLHLNSSVANAHLANVLASISSMLLNSSKNPQMRDFDLVGLSVTSTVGSTGQAIQGMRILSALETDQENQENLLSVCRDMIDSMIDFFKELMPIVSGQDDYSKFHEAAIQVSVNSVSILLNIEQLDVSDNVQGEIVGSATTIEDNIKAFTDLAAKGASLTKKKKLKESIMEKVGAVSESAVTLSSSSGILAAVISNPLCRIQMLDNSAVVKEATLGIQDLSKTIADESFQKLLQDATAEVVNGLDFLVEKCRNIDLDLDNEICEYHVELSECRENLLQSFENKLELFECAKKLTIFTTRLAECLKLKASQLEDELEINGLLKAAKDLTELTSQMVAATKLAISNMQNATAKQDLVSKVDAIQEAANIVVAPFARATLLQSLVRTFKGVVLLGNLLVTSARQSATSNRDRQKQSGLNRTSKEVTELIPKCSQAISALKSDPKDFVAKMKLLKRVKDFLGPIRTLNDQCVDAGPGISDRNVKQQLLVLTGVMEDELIMLDHLIGLLDQQIENEDFGDIIRELLLGRKPAKSTDLSGDESKLNSHAKGMQAILKNMVGKPNNTEDLACVLLEFQSIADLACAINYSVETELGKELLSASEALGEALSNFINMGQNTGESEYRTVVNATERLLSNLPQRREMFSAIGNMKIMAQKGQKAEIHRPTMQVALEAKENDPDDIQNALLLAASDLSFATSALVDNSKGNISSIKENVSKIEQTYGNLVVLTRALQSSAPGIIAAEEIQSIGIECDQLLSALQSSMVDSDNTMLNEQLADAARNVGDTIDKLLGIFSGNNVGLEACSKGFHALNTATNFLASCNNPIKKGKSYEELRMSLDLSNSKIQNLSLKLANDFLKEDLTKCSTDVGSFASEIEELAKSAANAAFLIANLDPSSQQAQIPPIDAVEIEKIAENLKAVVDLIERGGMSKNVAYDAANSLSLHAASICQIVDKGLPQIIDKPQIFEILETASGNLASITSVLVPAVRYLGIEDDPTVRSQCSVGMKSLLDYVSEIEKQSKSSGLVVQSAKPGLKAEKMQKAILAHGQDAISFSKNLLSLYQTSSNNNPDKSTRKALVGEIQKVQGESENIVQIIQSIYPGADQFDETIKSLQNQEDALAKLETLVKNDQLPEETGIGDIKVFLENIQSISDWARLMKDSGDDLRIVVSRLPEISEKFNAVMK
jgi:hypothetical protein